VATAALTLLGQADVLVNEVQDRCEDESVIACESKGPDPADMHEESIEPANAPPQSIDVQPPSLNFRLLAGSGGYLMTGNGVALTTG